MTRGMNHSNGITHAMLDALRGEREASHAALQRLAQDLQQHSPPSHRRASEYLVLAAHSAGQLGAAGRRRAACRRRRAAARRQPGRMARGAAVPAAQPGFVALLDQRLDEARVLLEPLAARPEPRHLLPGRQARVLLADLLLRQGRRDEAVRWLQPSADAAHAGGEVGGALLAGRPVLQRLAAADWGGRIDAGVLSALADRLHPATAAAQARPAQRPPHLSPRWHR